MDSEATGPAAGGPDPSRPGSGRGVDPVGPAPHVGDRAARPRRPGRRPRSCPRSGARARGRAIPRRRTGRRTGSAPARDRLPAGALPPLDPVDGGDHVAGHDRRPPGRPGGVGVGPPASDPPVVADPVVGGVGPGRPHPQQHQLVAALDLGPLGQQRADLDGGPALAVAVRRGPGSPRASWAAASTSRASSGRSARGGGCRSARRGGRLRSPGSGPAPGYFADGHRGADPRPHSAGRPDVAEAAVVPAPAHEEGPAGPRIDQQVDVGPQLGRDARREPGVRRCRWPVRGGRPVRRPGRIRRLVVDGGRSARMRTAIEGTGAGGRSRSAGSGRLATPMRAAPRPPEARQAVATGTAVAVSIDAVAHSCTSSMRVPNAPFGMDEGHRGPPRPGPRRLVDDPAAVVLDRLEGRGAVGHPVADVVEPLTLLLEVHGHRRVVPGGGEQLDVAVGHLEEGLFDAVGLDPLAVGRRWPRRSRA